MTVEAIGDQACIEVPPVKERTAGGIHVAGQEQEDYYHGKVLSVGSDVPDELQPGDLVVFSPHGPQPLPKSPGEETLIVTVHWSMILGKVTAKWLESRDLPVPA